MDAASWVQTFVAIIIATITSTGFWKYLETKSHKATMTNTLLMGLAHFRIIQTGFSYIERGWVTKDEYDDFINYLYKPYRAFGGNGLSERIFKDVEALPILGEAPKKENNNEGNSIAPA